MTLALELLAATRHNDLLREQRRLRLAALVARCRRALPVVSLRSRASCPA